jgi:hypothetical protein
MIPGKIVLDVAMGDDCLADVAMLCAEPGLFRAGGLRPGRASRSSPHRPGR